MSDKRRRNRVQGGWGAAPSNRKKEGRKEELKPNSVVPPSNTFVYKPTMEIHDKPDDKVYEKSGDYKLSSTENGDSYIELYYDFIEPSECDWIFEHLENNVPWKQENIIIKGEEKPQPRLTAWYGDTSYTYSGLTLNPHQFCPVLTMLKEQVEKKTKLYFNSVLANFYRNEKDSIDWHSDDETSLGEHPVIASLTFGDLRHFEMRQKPAHGYDFSYSQHVKVPLTSGCLLIMHGATQKDWQHRVGKEYHDHGPRINLTFRVMK